ncbi:hypothetical protein F5X68DRAFT_23811 [Plectosphaerella plurivora]|uniref:Uncharacterized protein n=1 Tax=Plectosphaerella plurivora TaxID=936078 RepID=A0A9P8V9Y1_9PEZI|nr:hypothetical protein F5X68DRAFT_23811 [Plectosphaerella plurivora]
MLAWPEEAQCPVRVVLQPERQAAESVHLLYPFRALVYLGYWAREFLSAHWAGEQRDENLPSHPPLPHFAPAGTCKAHRQTLKSSGQRGPRCGDSTAGTEPNPYDWPCLQLDPCSSQPAATLDTRSSHSISRRAPGLASPLPVSPNRCFLLPSSHEHILRLSSSYPSPAPKALAPGPAFTLVHVVFGRLPVTHCISGYRPLHDLWCYCWGLPLTTCTPAFMCVEHKSECPVCRRLFLVYVTFCQHFHPPLTLCPKGVELQLIEMLEGRCHSPVCPNSRSGGCQVI